MHGQACNYIFQLFVINSIKLLLIILLYQDKIPLTQNVVNTTFGKCVNTTSGKCNNNGPILSHSQTPAHTHTQN